MEREDNDYLQRLKHRAFLLGLDLCGCIRSQVEGDKRIERAKSNQEAWC